MKKFKHTHIAVLFLTVAATYFTSCTKRDQILNPNPTPTPSPAVANTDTLYSLKVTAGPTVVTGMGNIWNGNVDAMWGSAPKLKVTCTVPDLGNNTFTGFIGNTEDVTLRSLYDANNIYILAEWDGVSKNVKSSPWYFNSTTLKWSQESAAPTYDNNGVQTRGSFSQDQLAFMFNIANSCFDFYSQSCYSACHVNTSTMVLDTSSGNIVTVQHYGGTMHTGAASEKLDCWRARLVQVLGANQANDTYIDWGNGATNVNEIHNDPQVGTTDGGVSNKQTLKVTGHTYKVSVPMWMNINATYTNGDGFILASDTAAANGITVFVTAVDTFGILSYSATRGGTTLGTIDPKASTDYQQIGAGDGPKCIPGTIVSPYSGSRADVTANAFYTGTGWRLILKRALKTSDTYNQDVDFSSHSDQPFGIGLMFNGADNEHAVHPGMILHFK